MDRLHLFGDLLGGAGDGFDFIHHNQAIGTGENSVGPAFQPVGNTGGAQIGLDGNLRFVPVSGGLLQAAMDARPLQRPVKPGEAVVDAPVLRKIPLIDVQKGGPERSIPVPYSFGSPFLNKV